MFYTTTEGMALQNVSTHAKELVTDKKNERYAGVINHIITRLRFSLLNSILIAVRGTKGRGTRSGKEDSIANISFNLIPYVRTNEG